MLSLPQSILVQYNLKMEISSQLKKIPLKGAIKSNNSFEFILQYFPILAATETLNGYDFQIW